MRFFSRWIHEVNPTYLRKGSIWLSGISGANLLLLLIHVWKGIHTPCQDAAYLPVLRSETHTDLVDTLGLIYLPESHKGGITYIFTSRVRLQASL